MNPAMMAIRNIVDRQTMALEIRLTVIEKICKRNHFDSGRMEQYDH